MKRMIKLVAFLVLPLFVLAGCGTNKVARRVNSLDLENQGLKVQIEKLQKEKDDELAALRQSLSEKDEEIARLREQLGAEVSRVREEKEGEISRLEDARRELADSLQKELADARAKLEMTERGLVLTFVSEIFFDSGKDALKPEGLSILDRVSKVLNEEASGSSVAVEGHTDNEPIKYSGWKSNWELSAARALSVVHNLSEQDGVTPGRLSAVGYGEFKPVAVNDTPEGRQKNRRVEIVILPEKITKVQAGLSSPADEEIYKK